MDKIKKINISFLFLINLFSFLTFGTLLSMTNKINLLFPDKTGPIIFKYLFLFIIGFNFFIFIHILLPEYNKYLKFKNNK